MSSKMILNFIPKIILCVVLISFASARPLNTSMDSKPFEVLGEGMIASLTTYAMDAIYNISSGIVRMTETDIDVAESSTENSAGGNNSTVEKFIHTENTTEVTPTGGYDNANSTESVVSPNDRKENKTSMEINGTSSKAISPQESHSINLTSDYAATTSAGVNVYSVTTEPTPPYGNDTIAQEPRPTDGRNDTNVTADERKKKIQQLQEKEDARFRLFLNMVWTAVGILTLATVVKMVSEYACRDQPQIPISPNQGRGEPANPEEEGQEMIEMGRKPVIVPAKKQGALRIGEPLADAAAAAAEQEPLCAAPRVTKEELGLKFSK